MTKRTAKKSSSGSGGWATSTDEESMGNDRAIEITMDGDLVRATSGDEEVGRISVPHIDFQWAEDTFVPMGGIAGVGTDERFRRRGVAGRMMQRAVAHSRETGCICGGVSTGEENTARRLYSRAGYEYVFAMYRFTREPRSDERSAVPGVLIRGYEDGDEQAITQLRRTEYGTCFGSRKPDPSAWIRARRETLSEDAECALVATQNGTVIAYGSYFHHWRRIVCDLCVGECGRRVEVGRALVRALEARLAARSCEYALFSATRDELFLWELLGSEGYRSERWRVFKVNILDLEALLGELAPVLCARVRTGAHSNWSGTLRIETGMRTGVVALGDEPDRADLALSMSESTLTRVLSGCRSAWEAYLRGQLSVTGPALDENVATLMQVLLPRVPCYHPIDEWW